ncbi:MAG: DUF5687 family protein [Crocinitomicaceae bacterium]|nr:DUF5687 family protein [Crocinitomicaceae bacterium]
MIKSFLSLEWKSFTRSASFSINLVLKIILGIAVLFYSVLILMLGVGAYFLLAEQQLQPLRTVNQFLLFWWLADLIFRYFMQKAPVMWVKPLLSMPISKTKITHYLLGKSAFSFFNFYPFLFFLPFSFALVYNGYSAFNVIGWHLAIFFITFINNYINLTANNKEWFLGVMIAILASLGLSYYLNLFDVTHYSSLIFGAFYNYPLISIAVLVILLLLYYYNYRYYYKAFYLDDAITVKTKKIDSIDYSWLNRFGLMGTFLKNDMRLILRNKRSKNTFFMSLFFLFYGLLVMTSESYQNSLIWLVIIGVFVPGGFLFTFGGLVPSWDSSYYPLMMTQNVRYKEYLLSKWWLIVVVTFFSMIASSFYWWVEPRYYYSILAGGLYNIGINAYIVLLSGAYVKTPIDLTSGQKPFGDKNAFNIKTLLLLIPKMLLPVLIFYCFYWIAGEIVGFIALAVLGLMGLIFRNAAFGLIEKVYKIEKYDTIQAYKQKG